MGGSVRNRHLLRIAVILGVVLLVLYMFFSWQSDVKNYKEKVAASVLEYQDLLNKFNKLTDELKQNVQRAAETRHELETAQKTHKVEATRKDDQLKRCLEEFRVSKSKMQGLESQKERLESEREQLEQHQQSEEAEIERLSNEAEQLKVSAEQHKEAATTCKNDLEGVKAQLLSAQTDSLGASQKNQECQTQLSASTEAYEACQKRATSLEAENYNKDAEIQQLQAQINLLKQKQEANERQPRAGMKQPSLENNFKDISIMDSQKQKTLEELKEKLKKGKPLSSQEQHALHVLNQNADQHSQIPQKNKVRIPLNSDNGGNLKQSIEQQPPPPQPGGNPPPVHHADEEQVEDLVDGKNKKDSLDNLDVKEDQDLEGGAGGDDGGDQHEGKDYIPHDEREDFEERVRQQEEQDKGNEDFGGAKEEPLPDPVKEKEGGNGDDFPDKGDIDDDDLNDPHGHERFRMDQEAFQKEWRGRRQDPGRGLR